MKTKPAAETPSPESPPPEPPRKPYETPRLTSHGTLTSRTLAASNPPSDRALKERFEAVNARAILDRVVTLPVETWSYKGETARHLGPMAQDFAAAFGLGADDRHIFPLDAGGVALAAIQGLHAVVQAQDARLRTLERELVALRAEVAGRETAAVA